MNIWLRNQVNSKGARSGSGRSLAGASLLTAVSTALLTSGVAHAAEEGGLQLEEVLVTARKTEEKLQDIPVTVTALTAQGIEKLQIRTVFDLAAATPGLYYGTSGGRNGGNKLQIRNFATGTAGPSKASVFIDGVYSVGDYSSIPMANLERVEVLKGPQSAYFGRATFVGAVNFITRDPGNEVAGKVDLVVASEGEHDLTGFVSLPIIDDKLAQQFTVREYEFKGPNEWKTIDGYHLGSQSTRSISSKTVIRPTENVKLTLNYTKVKDDDAIPPVLYGDLSKRVPVARPDGTFGYYLNGPVSYDFSAPSWGLPVKTLMPNPGIRHDQELLSLRYDIDVNGFTIAGYAAKNKEEYEEQLDGTRYNSGASFNTVPNAQGAPTPVAVVPAYLNFLVKDKDEQFEIRLSSPKDKALRYTIGYNYMNIEGPTRLFNPDGSTTFFGNNYGGSFLSPAKDSSVFGGIYWDATDKITISAEGRYQNETITAESYSTNSGLTAGINYGVTVSSNRAKYTAFLPRVNVQFKVNDDLQVYALYSEGNNPGGFQPIARSLAEANGIPFAYDEEEVKDYEAGIKSTWLNGKLILNASVYHMDLTDQQLSQTRVVPGATNNIASIFSPGVGSKVDGIELEVNTVVSNHLELRGTVGYGKAEYKSFCSQPYAALTGIQTNVPGTGSAGPFNCRSVAGKQIDGTPALQTSLSANFNLPLNADWSFFVRPDWQYQSKVYNEEWNQSWIPANSTFNARLGFESGSWTFEGFVRNASDNDNTRRSTRVTDGARTGGANSGPIFSSYPALNGFAQGIAGQQNIAGTAQKPRQFGVRVAYQF